MPVHQIDKFLSIICLDEPFIRKDFELMFKHFELADQMRCEIKEEAIYDTMHDAYYKCLNDLYYQNYHILRAANGSTQWTSRNYKCPLSYINGSCGMEKDILM